MRIAEEKIADEELLADIAMLEDDDGPFPLLRGHTHAVSTDSVFCFVTGDEENDDEGMGQAFMQKRSAFKESSDRRVRAEQRKSKVGAVLCVCGGAQRQRSAACCGDRRGDVMSTDAVSLGCSSASR